METRRRILVIESDCARLTSLLLWLDQFAEFDVKGVLANADLQGVGRYASHADLILIADDEAIRNAHLYLLARGREGSRPLTVLLHMLDRSLGAISCDAAYDACFSAEAPLSYLYDLVCNLIRVRSLIPAQSFLPALAKAG